MQALVLATVFGVAILTPPSAAWAGNGGVPCCMPNASCQILSPVDCELAGGDLPLVDSCADPNPCIVCCRSGDPVSCQDNVTFRDCVGRPNPQEFTSRASCGSAGQCVPFMPTTVTTAPVLTLPPLLLALVNLLAFGIVSLRHRPRGAPPRSAACLRVAQVDRIRA